MAAFTPGSMPSPMSSSTTPTRRPDMSVAVGSAISPGQSSEVESIGSRPTMCFSRRALSATVRLNGPTWSSDDAKAMRP